MESLTLAVVFSFARNRPHTVAWERTEHCTLFMLNVKRWRNLVHFSNGRVPKKLQRHLCISTREKLIVKIGNEIDENHFLYVSLLQQSNGQVSFSISIQHLAQSQRHITCWCPRINTKVRQNCVWFSPHLFPPFFAFLFLFRRRKKKVIRKKQDEVVQLSLYLTSRRRSVSCNEIVPLTRSPWSCQSQTPIVLCQLYIHRLIVLSSESPILNDSPDHREGPFLVIPFNVPTSLGQWSGSIACLYEWRKLDRTDDAWNTATTDCRTHEDVVHRRCVCLIAWSSAAPHHTDHKFRRSKPLTPDSSEYLHRLRTMEPHKRKSMCPFSQSSFGVPRNSRHKFVDFVNNKNKTIRPSSR